MHTAQDLSGDVMFHTVHQPTGATFCASLKQNERAKRHPTLCRNSIKRELYCNESLLGKWYVCVAAYELEGTNLLLWLQTSPSPCSTTPDTGSGHTSAAHSDSALHNGLFGQGEAHNTLYQQHHKRLTLQSWRVTV